MNITTSGLLTLDGSKFIDSSVLNTKKQYLLKKGDILFNNTNSKELVEKTCYVDKDIKAVFSNHITRINVDEKIVRPKYLAMYLHTLWDSKYFLEKCKKWIGQVGIDLKELASLKIKIPTIKEQDEILEQLDKENDYIENQKAVKNLFTFKKEEILKKIWKQNF